MSNSNAAAIRRRTTDTRQIQQQPQQIQSQQSQQQPNVNLPGLTLPQVIAVIDKRLISLETFAKETKDSIGNMNTNNQQSTSSTESQKPLNDQEQGVPREIFNSVINEYNHRFEILAIEINNMKDVILKLQGFTMDVNKMLLDERINILSEAGNTLTISNPDFEDTAIDAIDNEQIEFIPETEEIQDA